MKTGFRTAGFAGWTLGPILQEIKRIGFDSVELCMDHPASTPESYSGDERRIDRVPKMLEEIELAMSSVSYHGDNRPLDEKIETTLKSLAIANRMGAGIFVMNTEKPDAGNAKQKEEIAERLKKICAQADTYGIDIAIEPEPGLFIASTDDYLEMAELVGSPRLKVNLDIGHAYLTDDSVVGSIKKLGDRIVHTHIEDIAGNVHKHLLPGEGDMDLPAIFNALDEIGYQGFMTIDLFDLGEKPEKRAQEALEALKSIQAKQ